MRLADFILANREPILAEWEAFARTCAPASGAWTSPRCATTPSEMLTVIAADLATRRTRTSSRRSRRGNAPATAGDEPTAAEEHGAGRAESGFTVEQMVAEYRALRASVIRLWTREQGELTAADIDDLTRFNEAIDQSLAESVAQYTAGRWRSRRRCSSPSSGHDLRTPLGAISRPPSFMLETGRAARSRTARSPPRIAGSATRTVQMVGDLLDFTRSRLGGGIPIVRARGEHGQGWCTTWWTRSAAAHPGRHDPGRDARASSTGEWDAARISQALANLIGNAVQHGARGHARSPWRWAATRRRSPSRCTTAAPAIPAERLDGIFNPMKAPRAAEAARRRPARRGTSGSGSTSPSAS